MANLMNLTKKQMAEIIERKDAVEKELRSEIKVLNKQVSESRITEEGLNVKIKDLETRLENASKDMDGTVEALKDAKDALCVVESDYDKLHQGYDDVLERSNIYAEKCEALNDKIKDLRLERNVFLCATALLVLVLILFI